MSILNSHSKLSRLKSRFGIRIAEPNTVSKYIIESKLKRKIKEINIERCLDYLNGYLKIPLNREEFIYRYEQKIQSENNVEELIKIYEEEGELDLIHKLWKLHGVQYKK